jgi:DNA modification methylase
MPTYTAYFRTDADFAAHEFKAATPKRALRMARKFLETSAEDLMFEDVLDWSYTGNRLHPTQKPVQVLRPLIDAFCRPGGIVLDPFCGSGSTLVAAKQLARRFIGIELDRVHYLTASRRLRE